MSHVLIVDDEESICWGLERMLKETRHEVSVSASAEEAFNAVALVPDLVVLDVRLPGMDGLSAMHEITHRRRRDSDRRDHGLWQLGRGGRRHAQRRVRLPGQTIRPGAGGRRDRSVR